jgi:hypothetical protein
MFSGEKKIARRRSSVKIGAPASLAPRDTSR